MSIVKKNIFNRLAGFIERTVLHLLSSRKNRSNAGNIEAYTPTAVGACLRLILFSYILCVYCCKHKVHNFVEVLDELYVRYFVSDADNAEAARNSLPLFSLS